MRREGRRWILPWEVEIRDAGGKRFIEARDLVERDHIFHEAVAAGADFVVAGPNPAYREESHAE